MNFGCGGTDPDAAATPGISVLAQKYLNERGFEVEAAKEVKEQTVQEIREQGVVKFFDKANGCGFITRPDTSELFVHFDEHPGRGI